MIGNPQIQCIEGKIESTYIFSLSFVLYKLLYYFQMAVMQILTVRQTNRALMEIVLIHVHIPIVVLMHCAELMDITEPDVTVLQHMKAIHL